MPDKPKIDDEDDLRARFADIERIAPPISIDEALPPVPQVKIERPAAVPLPGEPDYGKKSDGTSGRMLGGRMYGSGDMRSSGAALTIGTSLVGSIIVGTGMGWLLDRYVLHSTGTPWGLIAGFMLGVVSGFVQLIRVANQLNK